MMQKKNRCLLPVLGGLGILFLGACSLSLGGDDADAPKLYQLTAPTEFTDGLPKLSAKLVIEAPLSGSAIASEMIVARPSRTRLEYYAGARWSDQTPRLIQTRLSEAFANSGSVIALNKRSTGIRGDYTLQSDLIAFESDISEEASRPVVRIRMMVRLIRRSDHEIVAMRDFERNEEAPSSGVPIVVEAFDTAARALIQEIVEWTVTAIAADSEKS